MKVAFNLPTIIFALIATGSVQAKTIDLGTLSDAAPSFARVTHEKTLAETNLSAKGPARLDRSSSWLQTAESGSGAQLGGAPYQRLSVPFGDLDLRRYAAAGFAGSDGFFNGRYFSALKLGSVSKADFFSMLLIGAVLAAYQLRRKQKYLQHPLMMS